MQISFGLTPNCMTSCYMRLIVEMKIKVLMKFEFLAFYLVQSPSTHQV